MYIYIYYIYICNIYIYRIAQQVFVSRRATLEATEVSRAKSRLWSDEVRLTPGVGNARWFEPVKKWKHRCTHRIHGAGIYANIGGILMGSMLPYIATPWILWGNQPTMSLELVTLIFTNQADSIVVRTWQANQQEWLSVSIWPAQNDIHCSDRKCLLFWDDFHSCGCSSMPSSYGTRLANEVTIIYPRFGCDFSAMISTDSKEIQLGPFTSYNPIHGLIMPWT